MSAKSTQLMSSAMLILLTAVAAIGIWIPFEIGPAATSAKILSPLMFILTAVAVYSICYSNRLSKSNSFLPLYILSLSLGALGVSKGLYKGYCIALLTLAAYQLTLSIKKSREPVWRVFDITLLIGVATILNQGAVWLFLPFLTGLSKFNAINVKSISAMIVAIITLLALSISIAYLNGDFYTIYDYFDNFFGDVRIAYMSVFEIVTLSALAIFFLIALVEYVFGTHSFNTDYRSTIVLSLTLSLTTLLIFILTGDRSAFEPTYCSVTAILIADYIDNHNSKAVKILLLLLTIICLVTFIA